MPLSSRSTCCCPVVGTCCTFGAIHVTGGAAASSGCDCGRGCGCDSDTGMGNEGHAMLESTVALLGPGVVGGGMAGGGICPLHGVAAVLRELLVFTAAGVMPAELRPGGARRPGRDGLSERPGSERSILVHTRDGAHHLLSRAPAAPSLSSPLSVSCVVVECAPQRVSYQQLPASSLPPESKAPSCWRSLCPRRHLLNYLPFYCTCRSIATRPYVLALLPAINPACVRATNKRLAEIITQPAITT